MRSLTHLLKISFFVLAVYAKHDGQIPDDDGDDDDHKSSSSFSSTTSVAAPPPPSPTSTQTIASTSTVLSTSTSIAGGEANGSTSGTPASAASAAPSAIPSGAFQFSPPANVTMCEPAIFTWEFDVPESVPLTIMVTNERAVSIQTGAPRQDPLVERTLTTSVDARTCVVSWPQANVPEGQYTLLATDSSHSDLISAQSSPFFVQAGSDTSCLNQTSSDSASQPLGTSNGTTNDTADPQNSRSMSIGAIVGTIAGILVGVGGLLFVFSLPRLRRHILRTKTPQRPGGPYMLF